MTGRLIGPYRLEEQLGEGASARVFRAWHRTLQKSFALKLFSDDVAKSSVERERFLREAKALAAIAHPNVVSLIDFGVTEEGWPYLVMELVEGQPLIKEMAGHVPLDRVVFLADRIATALAAVHDAGAIHRDLKPANIMVLQSGEPKIVDFGLVSGDREMFPALTRPGAILGTPYYMSPEQVLKEAVTAKSDLYSLGVIIYEMLTGEMAFPGRGVVEILQAQIGPRPPSLVPRFGGLGALVDELIAKAPAERPASAEVVRDRVRHFVVSEAETPQGLLALPTASTRLVRTVRPDDDLTSVVPGALTASDSGAAATPATSVPPPIPVRRRPLLPIAALIGIGLGAWALSRPTELVSAPVPVAPPAPPPVPATIAPTVAPRPTTPVVVAPIEGPAPKKPRRKLDPPPPSLPGAAAEEHRPDAPEVILDRLGRLIRDGGHHLKGGDDARYFDFRERVARSPGDVALAKELEAFERELRSRARAEAP